MVKIIAAYLPQYHCIPENDKFWGKGFTDWVTVRNAKPLFIGHQQPRVPLSGEYYDLSHKEAVAWQCQLAREHGIYGFDVYHYWFNNEKNLLTIPTEIMRDSDDIDINYFLTWDNCSWKRSWSNVDGNDWAPLADNQSQKNTGPKILIPYILGTEPDWENHYNYCRTHFMSPRYIKKDNKPVFGIMCYSKDIQAMCDYWQQLAKKDGFDGIHFIFKDYKFLNIPECEYRFNYEPSASGWNNFGFFGRILNRIKKDLHLVKDLSIYDYDKFWNAILKNAKKNSNPNHYHGAFVTYDDTPRRGRLKGILVKGATPQKFENYMQQIISISERQKKDFLFLTAWNEWGEGAYLEPDKHNGELYLKALQNAIIKSKI